MTEILFENVDWKLLRDQKQVLVELVDNIKMRFVEKETLCGILNLLDEFQDVAVSEGWATEEEVFGEDAE
jgi:hypothetical protein